MKNIINFDCRNRFFLIIDAAPQHNSSELGSAFDLQSICPFGDNMLVEKIAIPSVFCAVRYNMWFYIAYLTARYSTEQTSFYQHFVPNGTLR
jgi:hypothetical protein